MRCVRPLNELCQTCTHSSDLIALSADSKQQSELLIALRAFQNLNTEILFPLQFKSSRLLDFLVRGLNYGPWPVIFLQKVEMVCLEAGQYRFIFFDP